jgi:putative ABC transport system ATP-binding protein
MCLRRVLLTPVNVGIMLTLNGPGFASQCRKPASIKKSYRTVQKMTILQAKQLTKTFEIGDRAINVLDKVSLNVEPEEFLVIKGSSGSGKTTLLTLLSGLDRPTHGRVFIEDRDITDMSEDTLATFRNGDIGFVFQSFHLVPGLTAHENIMFPAELGGDNDAAMKATRLMERVGMGHRRDNFAHQLSGGEKQRVAICRALINDPKIIFADEPTGNLDSEHGAAILELLLQAKQASNATLVLVTHSPEIAARADRIVTLADGRIVDGHD